MDARATLVGRRAGATAIALLVSWLLATGRWGAYLGAPGGFLFISEAVIGVALVSSGLSAARSGGHWPVANQRVALFGIGFVALCLVTLSRSPVTSLALRDAAPFAYAVILLLPVRYGAQERRWLECALVVRLAGTGLTTLMPGVWTRLPRVFGDIHVLQPRGDVDSAVLAILAGSMSYKMVMGRARFWHMIVGATAVSLVLVRPSRAGLLSLMVALAVVAISARSQEGARARMALGLFAASVFVGVLLVATDDWSTVAPAGSANRLVESVTSFIDPGSAVTTDAVGTTSARMHVWSGVLDYIDEEPYRWLVGVGFGVDYLEEAQVLSVLEGSDYENVRAPHNGAINALARLGIFGCLATVSLWVYGVIRGIAVSSRVEEALIPTLVLSVFFVAGLVGVVWEAPFGVIPMFWAVAVITTRGKRGMGALK